METKSIHLLPSDEYNIHIYTVQLIRSWPYAVSHKWICWYANLYIFIWPTMFISHDNPFFMLMRPINMNGKLYWKILFLSCFLSRCVCFEMNFIFIWNITEWSGCQMHQFSAFELQNQLYLNVFSVCIYIVECIWFIKKKKWSVEVYPFE